MSESASNNTPVRKKEHLELCLTDIVAFRDKSNGFSHYDFVHFAATEVEIDKIDLSTRFFGKTVSYPFLISCMTGGTSEAENINAQLAVAAQRLNIPLGVGSQRQALESKKHLKSYKTIRENAPGIPVLGNIGAAQLAKSVSVEEVRALIDLINADAFVIHLNPLQELVQKNGEPDFKGLLKAIDKLTTKLNIPVIAKEVGAGIGKKAARMLLEAGVKGIDVAGAGGTSWSGVEVLRNKDNSGIEFWDWGLPTSYCIRKVKKLKKDHDFLLIASGGINSALDLAKSLALGADMAASARIILQQLNARGADGVEELVKDWFNTVKKIMFLTGSQELKEFRKNKLIKKRELL